MQNSRLAHKRPAEEGSRSSAALAAIRSSIETKERVARECLDDIVEMAHIMTMALQKGRKVVFFGNGGSAADAQHISAELVGKRSEEHTSELQSRFDLVCRLLLEKKKQKKHR